MGVNEKRWAALATKSPASTRLAGPFSQTWDCLGVYVVREAGLEPAHPCGRQDLNLVRLPISPLTRISVALTARHANMRLARSHGSRAGSETGTPDQASARFYPISAALCCPAGACRTAVLECRARRVVQAPPRASPNLPPPRSHP
ncbi:hypothetical protein BVIET440_10195 [Burkholderia vietnamiensis]